MNTKKLLLGLAALLGVYTATGQQTLQLTQYIFSPLTINPAYAGYRDAWYVNAIYRQQWVGIEGAPRDLSVTADGYVNSNKTLALGAQILQDRLGPYQTTKYQANIASTVYFDKTTKNKGLSAGLGLGVNSNKIDNSMLKTIDDNDPGANLGAADLPTNLDVSVGVYYFSEKFYAGAAMLNLLGNYEIQANNGQEYFKNGAHLYMNFGTYFKINDNLGLKPFVIYKEDFKSVSNFDLIAMFDYKSKVWIGGAYQFGIRSNDNLSLNYNKFSSDHLSFILEWFIQDKYRLGYSYDVMLNGLSGYQNGSHEISVGIFLKDPSNYKRLNGPRLF